MNAEHDIAWPSQSRIASETGLSKPTVIKWLHHLNDLGWLITNKKFRVVSSGGQNYHHNEYMVSIPDQRLNELTAGNSTGKTVDKQRLNESVAEVKPFNTNNNINNNSNNNKENPYPEWLPESLMNDFIDHRKKLKSPMTDRAITLLINKLDEFRTQGQDIEAIINQSIISGWKSVFEVKDGGKNGTHRKIGTAEQVHNKLKELYLAADERERNS